MTTAEYYQALSPYYKSMYDMEQPYSLPGMECLAHGHFYSHSERYVLSRKAKLWESSNFEHAFFLERETLTAEDLSGMDRAIREYVEPALVRGGSSYPEPNHMYTYVTFVFFCDSSPDQKTIRAVKKYHFTRNYLFSIRGWCEARVVAVDLEAGKVYTNGPGASLTKLYRAVLEKNGQSKKGGNIQ